MSTKVCNKERIPEERRLSQQQTDAHQFGRLTYMNEMFGCLYTFGNVVD